MVAVTTRGRKSLLAKKLTFIMAGEETLFGDSSNGSMANIQNSEEEILFDSSSNEASDDEHELDGIVGFLEVSHIAFILNRALTVSSNLLQPEQCSNCLLSSIPASCHSYLFATQSILVDESFIDLTSNFCRTNCSE